MARRWRDLVPALLLLLLIGGLGLLAWISQDPGHPALEAGEAWPVVGPLLAPVRGYFLRPDLEGWEAEESGIPPPRPAPVPEDRAPFRAPSPAGPGTEPSGEPSSPLTVPEQVWVRAGTALWSAPSLDSRRLGTVEGYRRLPSLERHRARPLEDGERPAWWHRVRTAPGRSAWVRWVEPPAGEPPLGREPEPVRPSGPLPPDEERLAEALELLGPDRRRLEAGPYRLHTDVEDPLLLDRLALVAGRVEDGYRRRFGLEPVGRPVEEAVLFARRTDYRRFQASWERLSGLPASGHAGDGLVALFRGQRQPRELESTLVHEITHLLNRRALGPALPPWLDEGLAEDLTWCEIDAAGRLRPGTFGGDLWREGSTTYRTSGLAVQHRLPLLLTSWRQGRTRSLEELVGLDWETFVGVDRPTHYVLAGLLVRFLLEDPGLGDDFRRFLRETAQGERLVPERLLATLGLAWEELEGRFGAWLEARAQQAEAVAAEDAAALEEAEEAGDG